jgi:tetratricopeptide (TPR) repeat protein
MRTTSLLAAALGFVLLSGVALAGDLDEAQKLKEAGQFEEAAALFEKAAAADPGSAEAALGLTETLAGLGRYDDALAAVNKGLARNAEHVELLLARARTHLLVADKRNAEGADPSLILSDSVAEADLSLKAALNVDPKNADARVLKAKVFRYQGGGDSAESKNLLEEVVAENPDHFDAHWDLGKYHLQQGAMVQKDAAAAGPHWTAAEAHFRRCAEIDPKSGGAHWECANAMAWQRKPAPEVAAEYAQAAAKSPGNEKVLNQLYRWSGTDKAKRVEMFQGVAAARPAEPLVAIFLAFAQKEAGDVDGGLKTLAEAEKAMPDAPYVPLNTGHLLLDKSDTDGAVAAYERAVAAAPQFAKGLFDDLNGKAFQGQGFTPSQREKIWMALWQKWPDVVDTANNAGLWYRDVGRDYKKSSSWYLRAVEAAPESPQVLNDTALILDQYLKEFEMAEPYYRRAIQAGAEQGRNWRGGDVEDTGYRDAINNFGKMLVGQKRWADLEAFCNEHVPEAHPARGGWLRIAEQNQ